MLPSITQNTTSTTPHAHASFLIFCLTNSQKYSTFPTIKSCPFNVPFPKRIYDFRIWSSQPNYKELIRIGGRLAKLSTVPSPRRLGRVSNYNPRQSSSPSSPSPVIYHFIRGTKEIRRSRENNGGERLDVSRAISRKSRWRVGGLWQWKMGFLSFGRWATHRKVERVVGSIGVKEEQRPSVLLSWDIKRPERWTRLLKKPSLPFFCAPLKGGCTGFFLGFWNGIFFSGRSFLWFLFFFFWCKWNLR